MGFHLFTSSTATQLIRNQLIRKLHHLRLLTASYFSSKSMDTEGIHNEQASSRKLEIENVCSRFAQFDGGSMQLTRNEEDNVAILRISNASRKNAVSGQMMVQLRQVLTELEAWDKGKALLIHGEEGFFCSGGDQTTVKQVLNSQGGHQMGLLMQDNLKRLQALPLLSVAVIQGRAIGGGAELATACDFRLMTSNARIGYVHVNLGITAGWGGGTRLVHLLGPSKALDLMTSGKQLSADDALKLGLINDVIDEGSETQTADVLEAAHKWLASHINGSVEVLRAIKTIAHSARSLPLQEALEKELDIFASVWGGPAHKKALAQNVKHR